MNNTHIPDRCAPSSHSAPKIAVAQTEARYQSRADELARRLGLPQHLAESHETDYDYLLQLDDQGLSIVACDRSHGPVRVDFVSGRSAHRRQYGGGRGQPLARALGMGKFPVDTVIDATAGFGADAFVMATLGVNVTLLEQSPILTSLLEQAIADAKQDPATSEITQRMKIVTANAVDWLENHTAPVADVIYLDPMYPVREKSAQVKKGMQLLHRLIGPDAQGEQLLITAISRARNRVVVKRPADALPLVPDTPDLPQRSEIRSPNTRYDIYSIVR